MLQALVDFNSWMDKQAGSKEDKNEVKAHAATLTRAAVREAVAHAHKHLDGALKDNPSNTEVEGCVAQMKKYLELAKVNDG